MSLQKSTAATAASSRILPLFDRVLVQKITGPVKTSTGVFLPEEKKDSMSEAFVLAVGPGARDPNNPRTLIPPPVKPGDKVILGGFGHSTVKLMGEEFLICLAEDILAKVKPE